MRTRVHAVIGLAALFTLSVWAAAQQRGVEALSGPWIGDLGPWVGDLGCFVTLNLKAQGGTLTGVVTPNSPQPGPRSTCTSTQPVEVLAFDLPTGSIRLRGEMFFPRGTRGTYRYTIDAVASQTTITGNWSNDSGEKRNIILARDVITGSWKGDWAIKQSERNEVSVDLKWDGLNVIGMIRPTVVPTIGLVLIRTKFEPASGVIHLEADAPGGTAHYVIDGTIVRSADGKGSNTMSGSWSSDGSKGSFQLTKQ